MAVRLLLPGNKKYKGGYGEWSSGPNECCITYTPVYKDGYLENCVYKVVPNTDGELISFIISVLPLYGNSPPLKLDCEARGRVKDKIIRMNLKGGSRVYVRGNFRVVSYTNPKTGLIEAKQVIDVTSIDFKR